MSGYCCARTGEHGQAIVEFALVVPVLILCLFTFIDFGRAIHAQFTLAQAVREGVRRAVIETETTANIVQTVVTRAVGIQVSSADVQIIGNRRAGATVIVAASCVFRPITPIISNVVGNSIQLQSRASMTVE
jgi:Flp pilus assembly protein TadG